MSAHADNLRASLRVARSDNGGLSEREQDAMAVLTPTWSARSIDGTAVQGKGMMDGQSSGTGHQLCKRRIVLPELVSARLRIEEAVHSGVVVEKTKLVTAADNAHARVLLSEVIQNQHRGKHIVICMREVRKILVKPDRPAARAVPFSSRLVHSLAVLEADVLANQTGNNVGDARVTC